MRVSVDVELRVAGLYGIPDSRVGAPVRRLGAAAGADENKNENKVLNRN